MLGGNIDQLVPPHVAMAVKDKLRSMGVDAQATVKMVALSND
jgi:hypothetical protein